MSWTERQQKMLQAMGLRVWTAPEAVSAVSLSVAAPPASPVPPVAPSLARAEVEREPVQVRVKAPSAVAPVQVAAAIQVPTRDVSMLDAPALAEAIASCRSCSLCEGRRQSLWGVGHAQAHWMVVGEAPSEIDDLCNEPFAAPDVPGATGREPGLLLDNMLRALGLTRQEAEAGRQVFITHALRCRPQQDRSPGAAELASCRPYLKRQIELIQPRIILALGRLAAQALLDTQEPLGKLRGRVHQLAGVPVVVSYAPSYLLRNPADKARAWEDLCLARRTLKGEPA